jgi:hypothetical protein
MNICEKASNLFKPHNHYVQATGVEKEGKKIKLRLFRKGNDIYYFRKNSRKYGYNIGDYYNLVDIIPIAHHKTSTQKWEDGWKKVKAKLEASQLWKEVQNEISIALEIGHEKMKLAYEKYWEISDENDKIKFLKTIDARLIGTNKEGKEYTKSSLIWSYAKLPRVKKMRFHKHSDQNQATLMAIQKAMNEKRTFHAEGRTGYDISFEYAPEKGNKAWYSEEFKGCGNGHYYLAINATHALFTEDD